MRIRSLIFFTLLLIFWVVISGSADWQHLFVGTILALFTVWFWHDLGPKLPRILSAGELLRLGRSLGLLVLYVIQSNIAVAKTLLFNIPAVSPVFVIMDPPIKTNWGRVLLATCITLTPGTVTIDVDPDSGRFIVHSLTEESAVSLMYWRIIHEIEKLENFQQRRVNNVVDNSRTYEPNSPGTV